MADQEQNQNEEVSKPAPIIINLVAGTERLNLAPERIAELLAAIAANKEYERLKELGYRNREEMIDYLKIKSNRFNRFTYRNTPQKSEPAKKWVHPFNRQRILFSKDYAEELKSIIENKTKAPEGWRSTSDLQSKYIGNNRTFNKLIRELIERKQKESIPVHEIRAKWAGLYQSVNKGKKALYISPEAINECEQEKILQLRDTKVSEIPKILPNPKNEVLLTPKNWISSNSAAKKYVIGPSTFILLIRKLIKKKQKENISEDEIKTKWAGIYLSDNAKRDGLFASPEAIRELEEDGLLKLREFKAPPVPNGWISANIMERKYIGNYKIFNKLIEELIEQKRKTEITEEEVKEKWAGLYSSGGREALYISPEAIAEMEEKKLLIKREVIRVRIKRGISEKIGKAEQVPDDIITQLQQPEKGAKK